MESTVVVKDISAVEKQIEVTVPAETVASEMESFYGDLRKTAKIKGFRPGKVPRSILNQYYGKQVQNQVISKIISETYEHFIKEKELHPVSQPIIDNDKIEGGKDFTYTARVEVQPEIPLQDDYRGLEVEQETFVVTDDDVKRYLEELRNFHAQLRTIDPDRPIQHGDFVLLDLKGSIEGAPLKSGEMNDKLIEIKPDSFLPGFTSQLVGLRKGTNREIEVAVPDDYPEKEIAGKTILFAVAIKDIKEKITPPLDDNFARDMGEFETLTDLTDHVRKELIAREEQRVRTALYNSMVEKILQRIPFEVPSSLVERQTEYLINDARSRLRRQGVTIDSSTMINRELKESYRPIAEFQVRRSFLLEAIAKKENIDVTPAEIKEQIRQLASLGQNVSALLQSAEGEEARSQLRSKILEDKTLAFLAEQAHITHVEPKRES